MRPDRLLALTVTAFLALAATIGPSPVQADDMPDVTEQPGEEELRESDPKRGLAIAKEKCSKCHALLREDDSPFVEAPPFRSFARKWPLESLEEALAEGIMTGHPAMPEFVFDPDDIDDFLAYLASIAKD